MRLLVRRRGRLTVAGQGVRRITSAAGAVRGGAGGQGLRSPEAAGITGAARRWTVSMISALSMPCR